jgi:ATP-binding cassette subfamily C (CFTR/MRP) protein 4
LKSSEETTDSEIDETKATINNSVEQLSNLSRQGSIGSVSSSIDENKLNGTRAEPIEVAETRSSGKVSCSIYLSYITAGGNAFTISFLLFICILTQMLGTGGDYWISYWYFYFYFYFDYIYWLEFNAKKYIIFLGLI